jgi:hypothetical protein
MPFQNLPGVKMINCLLWMIVLAGAACWVVVNVFGLSLMGNSVVEEETTLSILRSQTLTFLVTRRTATQIVVEHQESNWAGQWRGVLWAAVNIQYGIDLAKIQAKDIRRDGNVAFVTLPKPEVLDFSVEPGSVGVLSKSTAVPKIDDFLHNSHRRLLEGRLRQAALDFAQQRDLLPTRDELIKQLNDAVSLLANQGGVRLRFE